MLSNQAFLPHFLHHNNREFGSRSCALSGSNWNFDEALSAIILSFATHRICPDLLKFGQEFDTRANFYPNHISQLYSEFQKTYP